MNIFQYVLWRTLFKNVLWEWFCISNQEVLSILNQGGARQLAQNDIMQKSGKMGTTIIIVRLIYLTTLTWNRLILQPIQRCNQC